jgi:hypothetical protein
MACFALVFIFLGGDGMRKRKVTTAESAQGIEVYTHDILAYADEYVEQVRGGETDGMADYFPDMIYYIADRIPKPSNDDIELLDSIFGVYVRLCARYRVLPTLECFSWLVNINRTTFTDWSTGEYRASQAHAVTVKRWFNICKSAAVNRLTNKGGTDANLIFIAKAAYGMAETAPVQTQKVRPMLTADQLPKLPIGEQNHTLQLSDDVEIVEDSEE